MYSLQKEDFIEKNKDHFIEKYDQLDPSGPDGLKRLRVKYRDLKSKWKKITDNAKNGSGLAGKKDKEWYAILDRCYSDTNIPLAQVLSSAADSSLLAERDLDEHDSEGINLDDSDDRDDQLSEEVNNFIVEGIEEESSATSSKTNKRKHLVRSQRQALTQLSGNVTTLIQAQEKRW